MLDNLNSNFESSKAQRPDANDDEVEIDLLEIFYALKKKILLVLMVALAGGCIAAAYTQFLMTPIYSSTSSILVLSKETTLTSLADLQLGASLTSDYTVLITSTPVMEQVISDLNLDMTAEQLKESVSINNPTDTRILEITVNNTDSKMAKKIVDEIANVSSSYIGDKMEVIPPKIIEVGKIAHLMYQRKRHRKSKSCHKRPHKIVSEFYFCPGQFRQKYCKILSAIIVINFPL